MYLPQYRLLSVLQRQSIPGKAIQELMPQMSELMPRSSGLAKHQVIPEPDQYYWQSCFGNLTSLSHELCHGVDFIALGKPERLLQPNFGFNFWVSDMACVEREIETCAYQLAMEQVIISSPHFVAPLFPWSIAPAAANFMERYINRLGGAVTREQCMSSLVQRAETKIPHIKDRLLELDDFLFKHAYSSVTSKFGV